MKRLLLLLAFVVALSAGGCSHFSKQARQQRAYDHYVRKSSIASVRQSLKLRPGKVQVPQIPEASEPIAKATVSDGPQSVTAGSE